MQGSPDAKKPCKGILKTSSSFDKHSAAASRRKSAKFDELNVLQTYHPPDKDYGHMKIEEPKTPYNYEDPDLNNVDQLDADLLAEKLRVAADSRTSSNEDSSEDEEETEEQRARRLEFERRRKAHYNEFEAVKLARKLIEEEDDEDEDEEKASNKLPEDNDENGGSDKDHMDTEEKEDAQNTSPSSEH
ncbi:unnamed protein product [Hermetia illucens]|uniref:Protein phosphatase inhibitor 2 n=1 Tax=Hermetia illucens TaxID=343691 RepID=A0A7R8YRV3_HERIL|nr:protein phosphatase inhibitor 2 [Hermetia illucens]XP_037906003.1 protein phosphatase inhibitor 2 [Hermetia illucens]CAD7081900.1 unnamed protein product [Hermetia illucens]